MALKQRYTFIFFAVASCFVCLSCSRKSVNDKLIEYIKAEKALRYRIGQVPGIEDSVKMLSKKHGIDLTESYADLVRKPEAWVEILQELKNEK
ncbi:MAG: hypothetical protein WBB37_10850 [bacterium]